MFYSKRDGIQYYNIIKPHNLEQLKNVDILYYPIELDTEYQTMRFPFSKHTECLDMTLTIQHRDVYSTPVVFLTEYFKQALDQLPQIKELKSVPVCVEEYSVLDHMKYEGYNFHITSDKCQSNNSQHKNFERLVIIDHYGFFLTVDYLRMFKPNSEWFKLIKDITVENMPYKGTINHDRRLRAYTRRKGGRKEYNYITLDKWLCIGSYQYRICLSFHDTCAIMGKTSYGELCSNTGVFVNKDILTVHNKQNMLQTIIENPETFLEYAKNDVFNHKILEGCHKFFQELYALLDIAPFYQKPKPTIGATVQALFRSALMNTVGLQPHQIKKFTNLAKLCSHEYLTTDLNSTAFYLAKTNGGRCFNNRPSEAHFIGPIIDIDIKGCYGKALASQVYPLGRPIVIDYRIDSDYNDYLSLGRFLKVYGAELVYGLWYARITTKVDLSFDQDFFPSWIPPKNLKDLQKTDTSLIEEQGDDYLRNDITRVYSRQLHLSPLQDDGLEWIRNALSPLQRNEIYENAYVICAVFYPRSQRCDSFEEVLEAHKEHNGQNKTYAYNKQDYKVVKVYNECHKWWGCNIGELIINRLLKLRSKYSKKDPSEKPMNTLIKLVINTIYGDIVSPYFPVGNSTVGNNITGRARSMAWYMEKSLHGVSTITDGCCFEVNNVVKSRYSLTIKKLERLKIGDGDLSIRFGPLLERRYSVGKVDILYLDENRDNLEHTIKNHIKASFPKVTVIDKYDLEIKEVAFGMASHGASNYITMKDLNVISRVKMRSYKDREYITHNINADTIEFCNIVRNHARSWLLNIYNNPRSVPRVNTFVDTNILKTNAFRIKVCADNKTETWPGCSNFSVRSINECTLSAFLFQTHTQYLSWSHEQQKLKRKTRQSYEHEFTKHLSLDYLKMIRVINAKIKTGKPRFYSRIRKYIENPYIKEYHQLVEYVRYAERFKRIVSVSTNQKFVEDYLNQLSLVETKQYKFSNDKSNKEDIKKVLYEKK